MKHKTMILRGAAALLLLPSCAMANLKVADTIANLGATAAEKTPKAVVEVVGETDGNGTPIPSIIVRHAANTTPLLSAQQQSGKATVVVGGTLQIGDGTGVTCTSTLAGTLRFDSTTASLVLCDGTNWVVFSAIPAGTVTATAAQSCAAGWLLADGTEYDQAAYPQLFAAIGTTYNAPDTGATLFRVPDYRGYFLRGLDADGVVDTEAGRSVGSVQGDDVGPHTHDAFALAGGTGNVKPLRKPKDGVLLATTAETGEPNTDIDHPRLETRPANIAVLYCVKY